MYTRKLDRGCSLNFIDGYFWELVDWIFIRIGGIFSG
jgi:hypothetical protein